MGPSAQLVLGPGARLAALGRCLRLADGAAPLVLRDLVEALEQPFAAGACLVLDAAETPFDDLGLLRRVRAAQRGLAVLWTAGPAELHRVGGLVEPDDRFRPWPLDAAALVALAEAGTAQVDPVGAAYAARTALGDPRGAAAGAGPGTAPAQRSTALAGPASEGSADDPESLPALDPELAEIEAILAGLRRPPAARGPAAAARQPGGSATAPPRRPEPAGPSPGPGSGSGSRPGPGPGPVPASWPAAPALRVIPGRAGSTRGRDPVPSELAPTEQWLDERDHAGPTPRPGDGSDEGPFEDLDDGPSGRSRGPAEDLEEGPDEGPEGGRDELADEADLDDPRAPRVGALAALADLGPLLTAEELEAFLAPDGPEPEEAAAPCFAAGAGRPPTTRPVAAPRASASAAEVAERTLTGAAATPPEPSQLPRWYRDQVADLADLVQRTELALHAADDGPGVAGARAEVGRLRQFARTLGCLAAPPAAGRARVDLGVLVEECLGLLAQRPAGAGERPRFLFRTEPGVEVLADKGLLVAALDAVLQVAAAAGGGADVVRTEVLRADAGVALVRVDLPEGRLAGLDPARILEPYGLKARLEGIGPNALAAAGGILVGHGGDLCLSRRTGGRLGFDLRLPVAPPA